jgi:hypothetical protein
MESIMILSFLDFTLPSLSIDQISAPLPPSLIRPPFEPSEQLFSYGSFLSNTIHRHSVSKLLGGNMWVQYRIFHQDFVCPRHFNDEGPLFDCCKILFSGKVHLWWMIRGNNAEEFASFDRHRPSFRFCGTAG